VALEACGLALDIIIVALPITSIWRLQIRVKQKFQFSLALSAGVLWGFRYKQYRYWNLADKGCRVVVITDLRLKAMHLVTSTDLTHDKGYLSLLSNTGALIAVISCSEPAISAFFVRRQSHLIRRTATRIESFYNTGGSVLAGI
jgi:hypothetical protein